MTPDRGGNFQYQGPAGPGRTGADVHDNDDDNTDHDANGTDDDSAANDANADNDAAAGRGSGRRTGGADAGPEFLALEREMGLLLRRARATSGEMAREVHPDLEPAAYGLLQCLEQSGARRATELAAFIGVGKATVSRQLRALEELGIVTREPDPADGRASLIHLSGPGRDRFRAVRDARRKRYVRRLAGWDRAEVAELARLIGKLNASQEAGEEPRG